MSQRPVADRAAREAAQTVFDRPLLLEAGAGTGKTTTLVARVLSWCLGEGWKRSRRALEESSAGDFEDEMIAAETLQGVVAITFTEAAAAEMAERLAASLAQIVDGAEAAVVGFEPSLLEGAIDPATRRHRATLLLESFDYLTVGTIHSFCYGLLRNHPLEAGLHPDLRVDADGRELETVARAAVEHWVQKAYTAGSETPFLALAARRIGPGRLLDAVVRWYSEGVPIELLEPDPFGPGEMERFLGGLSARTAALLELVGERLADLPAGRVARRVQSTLEASIALLAEPLEAGPAATAARLEAIRDLWPDKDVKRIRDWGRARFTGEETARLVPLGQPFVEMCEAVASDLRTAAGLDSDLLTAARMALLPLLRQVDDDLRTRGAITFSGLLREAQALLESAPGVLERERRRISALLVDEFQDTDPRQSEIVRRLGLDGAPDERPSLFVVGDPKQSIYAWRDADLAAYEAFQSALVEAGGATYSLEVNFRSTARILDEVERVIEPVMRYEAGIQPEFRPLAAAPGRKTGGEPEKGDWRSIEYWVSWGLEDEDGRLAPGPVAETTEVEAYELAADIRSLHDRAGVPWNRIGILFRKAGSQPDFLGEMRRQDVPFAVTRDRNYYQRREVIEAAAWVRAIVNPTDHLALLAVLRSSVVGVPDAALLPLWAESFPKLATELTGSDRKTLVVARRLIEKAAASVPRPVPGLDRLAGWEESLLAALAALGRLRESYRVDAPDTFVRTLRSEMLSEISEAARFQGKFRLANLHRFFRQLETAMQSDEADVHAILRALRLGVTQAREAEEAMPRDAAQDAVQVMTIHTAKGLEFDHVYVPQLHARTRRGGEDLLAATEVTPGRWQYQLFGAQTLDYDLAERRREHIEAAEMVRTLYVAMTRACRRLVLVGRWPEVPEATDPLDAKDYVDLLQSRRDLPSSLAEPANDAQVGLLGHWDDGDVRWRFLGGTQRHRASSAPRTTSDWLPSREQVIRGADRHARRASAATDRMARPWTEAVTTDISARLEELAATLAADADSGPGSTPQQRDVARESGTAVHACLEHWQLEAEPAEELERQQDRLERILDDPARIERAAQTLARFSTGELLHRLRGLSSGIIGREVPILLRSNEVEGGPVACYSGAIDLLYRDPEDGSIVVADFKTDRVTDADELARRAAAYRPQEERYARGVQQMLGLEDAPRTELWFVWADTIHASAGAAAEREDV